MRHLGITAIIMAITLSLGLTSRAESAPAVGAGKVGLVLSGGGAKGIAHIGVIQALEDNNVPIDYITGTSMGAIVGSLYAAGFTPAEMLALIASPGFADWSTGNVNPDWLYYFLSRQDTPALININVGKDSTHIKSVLPMSLINPIPMNMAFLDIYSRFTAQCRGDFDRLFVPFRCVTSDVYAKHKVVLSRGSLADAVRMSMSFPMVFEPIEMNGVPMYDGGIYDNFPVDVMVEEFNPEHLIGVSVGSKDGAPDTRNPMAQLEDMIMQPNNYPFPYDKGVKLRIDLDEFSLLDFGKYQEIYDIGYRRGMAFIDTIRGMIKAETPASKVRTRREAFKRATPTVRIGRVNVTGGTPAENAYLKSLFVPRKGHTTMSLAEARDAYYRAISSGRLQNFVPTPVYNPSDSTFTLNYKAVVKEDYNVGIGGYVSSSTNSMLFFHTGYNKLSFNSINADINAWVGQSYLAAEGTFSMYFNTGVPSAVTVRGVASRLKYYETEKLFYEIKDPDFIRRSEAFVQTRYTLGPTLRSRVDLQLGGGHLTDSYHDGAGVDMIAPGKDTGVFNLWQAAARWEANTLDNTIAPTEGSFFRAVGMGVAGAYRYRDNAMPELRASQHVKWLQLDMEALHYWPLGKKFAVGTEGRALLSTRKLLPTYQASIVAAEAIHPTPSSYNVFSRSLRANSFLSATVEPVWKVTGAVQVRGVVAGFLPLRKIECHADGLTPYYGHWLGNPEVFTELQALVKLPLGTISAYGNYTSGGLGWNFGISIGTFILAPRFLE